MEEGPGVVPEYEDATPLREEAIREDEGVIPEEKVFPCEKGSEEVVDGIKDDGEEAIASSYEGGGSKNRSSGLLKDCCCTSGL